MVPSVGGDDGAEMPGTNFAETLVDLDGGRVPHVATRDERQDFPVSKDRRIRVEQRAGRQGRGKKPHLICQDHQLVRVRAQFGLWGSQIDGSLVVDTLGEQAEKPVDRPGKRIGTGRFDTDMSHLPAGRAKRLDKGLDCSVQLSGLRVGEDNRSPRAVEFGIHGGTNFRRLELN